MIDIKTPEQIAIMHDGGQRLGKFLFDLLEFSRPGIRLNEIEAMAIRRIKEEGGTPSFQTVEGYHWATCLCVNEVVVHGIPTDYLLKDNDLLTIDIGMVYKGFHTDTAWTKIIRNDNPDTREKKDIAGFLERERLIAVGEKTLWKAIDKARVGNRIGHISKTIGDEISGAGYSIIKSLVGHGVGKNLHEDPQVPGYLRGLIENTPELVAGMTIAIEIIYAQGGGSIVYENDDGWTLSSRDRSLTSVFEHTVAITEAGPIVITKATGAGI